MNFEAMAKGKECFLRAIYIATCGAFPGNKATLEAGKVFMRGPRNKN